jgi:hypothetical protein
MGSTNRWSKQMADDLTTVRGVLDALVDGGPDAAEALFAGVEAGKRYIYGEAYLGPAGLTPTPLELAVLLHGLAAWAVDYEPAVDPAPLLAFRQMDLSRCRAPMGNCVSGFIAVGLLPDGQWELAAQRAVEALDALTGWLLKRREPGNGLVGMDLDKVASSLGLPNLRTGSRADRAQDLLMHALRLLQEWKDRNPQDKAAVGHGTGPAKDTTASARHQWITVSEGESLCFVGRGTISRAITDGKIASNGERGTARRIYTVDLVRCVLERANRPEREESGAAVARKIRKAAEA